MKNYFVKMMVVVAIIATLIPSVSSAAYLSVGSRGNDVADLQSWLIGQGFPIPFIQNGVATPGYFGSQTSDAVKMYQESKGLSLTGSIDSNVIFGEEPKLGAVVGPDDYSPYKNQNGIRSWFINIPATTFQATTTVCSYRLPQATTTIDFLSFSATQLASSTDLEIGTDTINAGTSTSIVLARTIPTGGGYVFVDHASTTASYSYFTNSANGSAVIQSSSLNSGLTLVGSFGTTTYKYINWKLGANATTTAAVCKGRLVELDGQK